MIHSYLPENWDQTEKNIKTFNHSKMVANAPKIIASKTSSLDQDIAYNMGLMHDIGKFYLSKEESYKHPRIGYELSKEKHPDIAIICITHGFPNLDLYEHILHYCHKDKSETDKVFDILKTIKTNDYIELIQFCDKISTIDGYVKFEEKLDWYLKTYNIPKDELVKCYSTKLNKIKNKFDKYTQTNIYDLLCV